MVVLRDEEYGLRACPADARRAGQYQGTALCPTWPTYPRYRVGGRYFWLGGAIDSALGSTCWFGCTFAWSRIAWGAVGGRRDWYAGGLSKRGSSC